MKRSSSRLSNSSVKSSNDKSVSSSINVKNLKGKVDSTNDCTARPKSSRAESKNSKISLSRNSSQNKFNKKEKKPKVSLATSRTIKTATKQSKSKNDSMKSDKEKRNNQSSLMRDLKLVSGQ